jgi:predicted XRE-type DNA-binding protein
MAKKDYQWPSRKDIDAFLKYVEENEDAGTLALDRENATPLDLFRWEICQQILIYKRVHDMTQRELASTLEMDEAEISRILHHRIDKVSTDKLAGMIQKLNPKVKLSVVS